MEYSQSFGSLPLSVGDTRIAVRQDECAPYSVPPRHGCKVLVNRHAVGIPVMFACPTCDADRITTDQAYDVVNDVLYVCESCERLAWLLVAKDLDACYGVPE